jgi:hypothetical protein
LLIGLARRAIRKMHGLPAGNAPPGQPAKKNQVLPGRLAKPHFRHASTALMQSYRHFDYPRAAVQSMYEYFGYAQETR